MKYCYKSIALSDNAAALTPSNPGKPLFHLKPTKHVIRDVGLIFKFTESQRKRENLIKFNRESQHYVTKYALGGHEKPERQKRIGANRLSEGNYYPN